MDSIQSGNLLLRDFTKADVSAIYKIISKPNFIFSNLGKTHEDAELFVQKCIERSRYKDENGLKTSFRKAIIHPDHNLVGFVVLGIYDSPAWMADGYELATFVDPEHDGKGYGIRSCRMLLDHVANLGVRVFYATASPENQASIRAQKFLGFNFIRDLNREEMAYYNHQPKMLFRLAYNK